MIEANNRSLRDKEDEVNDLKIQVAEVKNVRFNTQELHDALIHDFKKTISVKYLLVISRYLVHISTKFSTLEPETTY